MCDLPYFCHICTAVVYIEDKIECPICHESFLEIYTQDTDEDSQTSQASEPEPRGGRGLLHTLLGGITVGGARQKKRKQTITSDRRNYAIGPEIHDVITRLREEKNIEENPASNEHKARIEKASLPRGEVCMICLTSFENAGSGAKYPCGHHFHGACSDAWLEVQCECPICRTPL